MYVHKQHDEGCILDSYPPNGRSQVSVPTISGNPKASSGQWAQACTWYTDVQPRQKQHTNERLKYFKNYIQAEGIG